MYNRSRTKNSEVIFLKKNKGKMIAPIIVTVLFVAYFVLYFALLISTLEGVIKYALGIIPLLFMAVILAVCIERIKEIKKGEEDDLSKY
jgi:hypothetical protein